MLPAEGGSPKVNIVTDGHKRKYFIKKSTIKPILTGTRLRDHRQTNHVGLVGRFVNRVRNARIRKQRTLWW